MKKIKENIITFFNGFMMALADSVPGVSGGTIAFLLGFYDGFINSLNSLIAKDKKKKEPIIYLAKLGIGWGVGLCLSVLLISSIFEKNIYKISSLFIGFILFSIPIILKEEKECLKGKYLNIIFTFIGIALVLLITRFNSMQLLSISLLDLNLSKCIYIFICGMVAISAMVLPGISGSTLLLIFGLYFPVINGVKDLLHFNFSSMMGLIVFGLGVITGILTIIKLLKKALEKYRTQTIYTIIGLMLGSIYSIIVGPTTLDIPLEPMYLKYFSFLFFIIGGMVVWGLQMIKNSSNNSK